MARERTKIRRRLELIGYRLRLRLSWESSLAALNLRYISRFAMDDLNRASEAGDETHLVVLQLSLTMFHHHVSAAYQLLAAGNGYDAAVCARGAVETMALFIHFSHDKAAAARWFEGGRAPNPAQVRKEVKLSKAFTTLYGQLCDYTHPNFSGVFTFLRKTRKGGYEIRLGPQPITHPEGLLRVLIVSSDELLTHAYHHGSPSHPKMLRWLRNWNTEQRLLPLPMPGVS